jgi:hypothetical protein
MSKRIKITESQYKRVRKALNEAGGYDDQGAMAVHGTQTQIILKHIIDDIIRIVDETRGAFENDVEKEDLMDSMNNLTGILYSMKDTLKKIIPELVNDDLKSSTKDLYHQIVKSEKKLRLLSNQSQSFINTNMPPAVGGLGHSMGQKDFNDYVTNVVLDLGNKAEKVAFQIHDEDKQMFRRLGGENMN